MGPSTTTTSPSSLSRRRIRSRALRSVSIIFPSHHPPDLSSTPALRRAYACALRSVSLRRGIACRKVTTPRRLERSVQTAPMCPSSSKRWRSASNRWHSLRRRAPDRRRPLRHTSRLSRRPSTRPIRAGALLDDVRGPPSSVLPSPRRKQIDSMGLPHQGSPRARGGRTNRARAFRASQKTPGSTAARRGSRAGRRGRGHAPESAEHALFIRAERHGTTGKTHG